MKCAEEFSLPYRSLDLNCAVASWIDATVLSAMELISLLLNLLTMMVTYSSHTSLVQLELSLQR